ncbi:MAG: c-type cytochrome [Gammaproteobacteria bacterium]|nr:c-type cytochrome [Gammaproteobacteria bacterium]
MKQLLTLLFTLSLSLLSPTAAAFDLANGERINRNCGLCHGVYGQGTAGRLSPRLAGMPREYLIKAMEDFKEGKRTNPTMEDSIGLAHMVGSEIEDVSAYLSMLDLSMDSRFDIVSNLPGDPKNGEELYMEECKTCHGRDGRGRASKEAPPSCWTAR